MLGLPTPLLLALVGRLYLGSAPLALKVLIQSLTHSLLRVVAAEYQTGPTGLHKTMAALVVVSLMMNSTTEHQDKEILRRLFLRKEIMAVKGK
jgi:hypothetical protein